MSEVHHGRGYVYSIQYQLGWCVKYRQNILQGNIDTYVKKLLNQIALNNDIQIVEMESDKDHIHMLIECKLQQYLPNIVKAFKGVSARFLFKEYLESEREMR
ncbi:MAG: IS200/IS605 family transposase [Enterococcus sp.]